MEHQLTVKKTARYYTYGNPEKANHVWFVLHGYGQLAYFFLRKFHALDPDHHFIVAPEGMHRFYLNGTSGRVGASWMTKEARLDDIANNHDFLDDLSNRITEQYTFEKRTILGFSQGGATAARWHQKSKIVADQLVLWASVFPDDVEKPTDSLRFKNSSNHFVIGKEDPYFKLKYAEIINDYKSKIPGINLLEFDGQHDIHKETLLKLAQL
jgi:predicted esterase